MQNILAALYQPDLAAAVLGTPTTHADVTLKNQYSMCVPGKD